jgi:hypothetical protein
MSSSFPANEGLAGPDEVFVVGPRSLSTELSARVDGINRSYLKLKLNYRFDYVNNQFFFPRQRPRSFQQARRGSREEAGDLLIFDE